jgi:hypothetical protein
VIETGGAGFCPHHLRLADEHSAETVRNGSAPKRRSLRVVEEPTMTIIATMDEPTFDQPDWSRERPPTLGRSGS